MSILGNYEFWTAAGTGVAAIAAAIAAIMSYQQVRLVRAADIVASLYFVGNLRLALQVTNHGGTARRMRITYTQIAGPEVIRLIDPKVAILNHIDVLPRSEIRAWEIGEVPNPKVFTQDYQLGALALDTDATRAFEQPFTLQVSISWEEPAVKRQSHDTFILIADKDLFDRSPKKQFF